MSQESMQTSGSYIYARKIQGNGDCGNVRPIASRAEIYGKNGIRSGISRKNSLCVALGRKKKSSNVEKPK